MSYDIKSHPLTINIKVIKHCFKQAHIAIELLIMKLIFFKNVYILINTCIFAATHL